MSFSGQLIHQCDIYRPSSTTGIYGEDIPGAETLVVEDEACRYAEKSEKRFSSEAAADVIVTTYLLLLGPGADIQERDIIRNVDLTPSTTIAGPFYVEEVRNRFSTKLAHKSCVIRLVKQ